jgi:hypothetical protein
LCRGGQFFRDFGLPADWCCRFDWLWPIDCVERLPFAAIDRESAPLDCFTSPPPQPQSFLLPLATAMFGAAFTATDLDFADWSIKLEASCDWSFVCEPEDLLQVLPACFWSFDWLWSADWFDLFWFAATAVESALLLWSTGPWFSTATFGDALTAADLDCADWSIELEASCDWSLCCDEPLPPLCDCC